MAGNHITRGQKRPDPIELFGVDLKFESAIIFNRLYSAISEASTTRRGAIWKQLSEHGGVEQYEVKVSQVWMLEVFVDLINSKGGFLDPRVSKTIQSSLQIQLESIFRSHVRIQKLNPGWGDLVKKIPSIADRAHAWGMTLRQHILSSFAVTRDDPIKSFKWHKYSFTVDRENVIIETPSNKHYTCPRGLVTLMYNKLMEVGNVIALSCMLSGVVWGKDFGDTVISVWMYWVRTGIKLGEGIVPIMKLWDGILMGEILKRGEDWKNERFFNTMCDELANNGFIYDGSGVEELLRKLSIPEIHELVALEKLILLPSIDLKAGIDKLKDRARSDLPINTITVARIMCSLIEDHCKRYYSIYGQWPPLAEPVIGPLKVPHKRNLNPNKKELLREVRPLDWFAIKLATDRVLECAESPLPYLKDKAISVMRSEAFQAYVSKTLKYHPGETRLLLYFLLGKMDHISMPEFIHDYGVDIELVKGYAVMKLTPKELELKKEGRLFGQTTAEMRTATVALETNVMEYMNRFHPSDQALTISELQVLRHFWSFQNLRKVFPGSKVVHTLVDASAWNNRFSDEVVGPICMHSLDRFFGTSAFSKVHKKFMEQDYYCPQDGSEDSYWRGQRGGIEGQHQATWSLIWNNVMKVACGTLDIASKGLGKGDDYRRSFIIPRELLDLLSPEEIAYRALSVMEYVAKLVGQKIKVNESYASEKLFRFSRVSTFEDSWLSSSLKKGAKIMGDQNCTLPTSDSYVANIFSTAHAACFEGVNHLAPYILALRHFCLHMIHMHPEIDVDALTLGTLWPSPLGGYQVIPLIHFFVRSESDHLSTSISLYRDMPPHLVDRLKRLELCDDVSYRQLLEDPYSLPIRKPPAPTQSLSRSMIRALKRFVKNQSVREVIAIAESEDSESFISGIISMIPYYDAKIGSALWDASIWALLAAIISKFENSQTVIQSLILGGGKTFGRRVIRKLYIDDHKIRNWRYQVLTGKLRAGADNLFKYPLTKDTCSTEYTRDLRNRAWRLDVRSVTYPAINEMVELLDPMGDIFEVDVDNHFVLLVHPPDENPLLGKADHYLIGKSPVFLGSITSSGMTNEDTGISLQSATLSQVIKLSKIVAWTNQVDLAGNFVSNIPDICNRMAKCYRVPDLLELCSHFPKRERGTVTHRFRARGFNESIVPNNRPNIYTRCRGISDTHRGLRTNPNDNVTVNYMSVYCHGVCLLLIDLEWASKSSIRGGEFWIKVPSACACMDPIMEQALTIQKTIRLPGKLEGDLFVLTRRELEHLKEARDRSIHLSALKMAHPMASRVNPTRYELSESIDLLLNKAYHQGRRLGQHAGDMLAGRFDLAAAIDILADAGGMSSQQIEGRVSEIRRIDLETLTSSLVSITLDWVMNALPTNNITAIRSFIRVFPMKNTPLYGIYRMFMQAGCLGRIVCEIAYRAETSPLLKASTDPSTASLFVSLCILTLISNGDIDKLIPTIVTDKFSVTVNEDDDDSTIRSMVHRSALLVAMRMIGNFTDPLLGLIMLDYTPNDDVNGGPLFLPSSSLLRLRPDVPLCNFIYLRLRITTHDDLMSRLSILADIDTTGMEEARTRTEIEKIMYDIKFISNATAIKLVRSIPKADWTRPRVDHDSHRINLGARTGSVLVPDEGSVNPLLTDWPNHPDDEGFRSQVIYLFSSSANQYVRCFSQFSDEERDGVVSMLILGAGDGSITALASMSFPNAIIYHHSLWIPQVGGVQTPPGLAGIPLENRGKIIFDTWCYIPSDLTKRSSWDTLLYVLPHNFNIVLYDVENPSFTSEDQQAIGSYLLNYLNQISVDCFITKWFRGNIEDMRFSQELTRQFNLTVCVASPGRGSRPGISIMGFKQTRNLVHLTNSLSRKNINAISRDFQQWKTSTAAFMMMIINLNAAPLVDPVFVLSHTFNMIVIPNFSDLTLGNVLRMIQEYRDDPQLETIKHWQVDNVHSRFKKILHDTRIHLLVDVLNGVDIGNDIINVREGAYEATVSRVSIKKMGLRILGMIRFYQLTGTTYR